VHSVTRNRVPAEPGPGTESTPKKLVGWDFPFPSKLQFVMVSLE
jgi:hypothetical protein